MADLTRKELVKLLSTPFRTQLTGTDLGGLDLNGLNFGSAYLTNANLNQCNLQNVGFYKAELTGVNFVNSDVRGADFEKADLRNADFSGSFFDERTNLKGALLKNTIISQEQKNVAQTGISSDDISTAQVGCLATLFGFISGFISGGKR